MKAVVQDAYGSADDLELREIERPVARGSEVLVRVRAASVHPDVWHVVTGLPFILRLLGAGLRRPRPAVPGTDLSGVVDSVGERVTRFEPGDEVFGETLKSMQWIHGGAYAEFATAPEDGLVLKPPGVSFEAAAAVPTAALIALPSLGAGGEIQAGQEVLINGAGGGVGSLAVQLAKASGAHVTGVDCTPKLDLVRALGADRVLDYTREDFTLRAERYDLIFDIPGNHSLRACRRALKPAGTYVLIGHDSYGRGMHRWIGLIPRMLGLMARAPFTKQLPDMGRSRPTRQESLALVARLLASGELTPHIDRTYELGGVPEALRHLQSGQVRGKIVICM